jgi:hypothetical protein
VWSLDEASHVVTPVEADRVAALRLKPSPQPPLNADAVVVIVRAN